MKKSIPLIRERESEAFILGNGREREFPLTPVFINIAVVVWKKVQTDFSFPMKAIFAILHILPNKSTESYMNANLAKVKSSFR